jgi:hypothetical protein
MNFIEQLTAVTLLVDFFLGVTFGVVGGAVHGSLHEDREKTLLRRAPDLVSDGARVMLDLHTLPGGVGSRNGPADESRGDDSGAQGTEPKR